MKISTSLKTLALAAGMLLTAAGQAWAGDGTKANPYTVAELNAQKDALAASGNTVWVKADLKGLGEDGTKTDNATVDDVKQMAALFGDATGSFVAYSWQILGELSLSDLTNTKDLLISLTYGTAGHPHGNSANPQYASNYEPTEAHFSLAEVHGALSLEIKNGYRGYHLASSYVVPKDVVAVRVNSNFSKGTASIAYGYYDGAEEGKTYIINKNTAMVLMAYDGTYDFVLSADYYEQINSNGLNGGEQAGVNVIPMKNNALRYHYRFVADGEKLGFERNSDESTEVYLASKDEVYLTVNGADNHFFGNWTWETADKKWISWAGKKISDFHVQTQAAEVIFDFANNNQNLPYSEGGASDPAEKQNAGNLGGKTITVNGVKFSFVNSPSMCTKLYHDGAGTNTLKPRGIYFQMIKGGQMRITAPENKAVTKVAFVYNPSTKKSDDSQTFQTNITLEKGEGTLANDKLTWTGNAESVRFGASGAAYINSITVTLADKTAETVAFEADTYSDVDGLEAFNSIADNTLVKLKLTDAVITAPMANELGYYVQDAKAGAQFYCTGLTFNVGDKVSGTVCVKKSNQTKGARIAQAEDTNAAGLTVLSGNEVTPIEGTIDQVNVAANKLRVVKLTGVKVKGSSETVATITDSAEKTLEINNGKTNDAPYVYKDNMSTLDLVDATVIGILYGSNATTNKIYPLSITSIATGISHVNTDANAENTVIFNLQGVRQSSLKKGLNIVNGRKVVIKR